MRLIDSAGVSNLVPGVGEYAVLDLSVEVDRGAVLKSDATHVVYLLGEDGVEQTGSRAVVTDGRHVLLHAYPVGDTSGVVDPARNRTYVVTPLTEHWRLATIADAPTREDEEWLDTRVVDVDGDGDEETLYLEGDRSQEGLLAPGSRRLVVVDGDRTEAYPVPDSAGFYGTTLRVRDLTGDEQAEFLFYEYAGGSSNAVDLNVFSLTPSGLIPLFVAAGKWEANGLSCRFTSPVDVELRLDDSGSSWSFELPVDSGLDHEEGAWFAPGLDPFSRYDLVDVDGDGSVELVAYQLVSGSVHVEALGNLARVFSWDGSRFTETELRFYRYSTGWGLERVWPDG